MSAVTANNVLLSCVTSVRSRPYLQNYSRMKTNYSISHEISHHYSDAIMSVSNHRPLDCLLRPLFRCWSKKTSKLRVTGLSERNSPVTGEFPVQRSNNAENVPFHDVIIRFSHCWPFVSGTHWPPVDSPPQWVNGAELLSFLWTRCWTNSRVGDNLRRYATHYVTSP